MIIVTEVAIASPKVAYPRRVFEGEGFAVPLVAVFSLKSWNNAISIIVIEFAY